MAKALRYFISAALLGLVLYLVDWREVWAVLQDVHPGWLAVVLGLALVDRLLTNYRWQILLAGRGLVLGFMQLFRVQLAANFFGSFLPGFIGVDAVRITALCRSGESKAPVIAATLVDRATLAIATLLLGAATVLLLAESRVPPHIAQFVLALSAVAVLSCAACLLPSVRRWARHALLPRVPERFKHTVGEVAAASLAYRNQPWMILGIVFVTAAIFAVRILFAKAIGFACGVDIPLADLLLVIPILWVVVMLPITVGGIGVQDAGYVVLMALIGVAAPLAVSMSLIEHVISRLASLPGALFLGDVTAHRSTS